MEGTIKQEMIGQDDAVEASNRILRRNRENLEEIIKHRMIGQDRAVKAICRALRLDRAGIRVTTRPIASFLFIGPPGVGKAELAKLVAEEYFGSSDALLMIDVSLGMEKLNEAVLRHPDSLILIEDIEKAPRYVTNELVQILDNGRLTDFRGRTVNFKDTLIFLTITLNIKAISNPYSYDDDFMDRNLEKIVSGKLKKDFAPALLHWLDEVIIFKHLSEPEKREMVELKVKETCERIKVAKNVNVSVRERVKNRLVKEGFSQEYGAWPLRRAMDRHVVDRVAEKIIEGKVAAGGDVTI